MRKLAMLLLLLCSASANAVDYSKCAQFYFNNGPNRWLDNGYIKKIHHNGPFVRDRFRVSPVELTNNGTISVVDGQHITDYSTSQDGLITNIVYNSPPMYALESYSISGDKREAKLTIIRNEDDGSIVEIIEELPIDLADSEYYKTVIGTRTTFEVKNDQCVPIMSAEILGRGDYTPDVEGYSRTQDITFITRLCRDALEFNRRHSISLYDADLITEMKQIFDQYYEYFYLEYEDFFSVDQLREKYREFIGDKNFSDRFSLLLQLYFGYHIPTDDGVQQMMQMGMSPIVAANMALGNCYRVGLSEFLEDDALWEE